MRRFYTIVLLAVFTQQLIVGQKPLPNIDSLRVVINQETDLEFRGEKIIEISKYYGVTDTVFAAQISDWLMGVSKEYGVKYYEGYAYLIDGIKEYYLSRFSESVAVLDKSISIFEKKSDSKNIAGLSEAYLYKAKGLRYLGKTEEAIKIGELSSKMLAETKDSSLLKEAFMDLSKCYRIIGEHEQSIELGIEAIKIGDKLGEKTAGYKVNVASIYFDTRDFDAAFPYLQEALDEARAENDTRLLAPSTFFMGTYYSFKQEYESAIPFLEESAELHQGPGQLSQLGYIYYNLADCHDKLGAQRKAIAYFDKVLKIAEQTQNLDLKASGLMYKAEQHAFLNKNYPEAIRVQKEVVELFKLMKSKTMVYEQLKMLAAYYEKAGDYKTANSIFKEYHALKDSLTQEQSEYNIQELQTKYDTEKKEQEIALLSEKEKLQTAEITAVRNRNFLLLGLLGMLLLGGGAFYYRRQLNEQLRLQSMRSQISSDLHDEVGSSLAQLSMIMGSVEGSDAASAKNYLQKGNEILSSSISKIRDVVWAIDVKNDATGSLLDRMEDFAYDMLSAKNIQYKINNEGFDRNASLPPLIRQNFYLFYKEAITNIYKHSNATDVQINFYRKGKNISLKIADNGNDLNNKKVSGSGIENMKLRAKKIGGTFDFEKNETGFSVSLNAPTD